MKNEFKSAVGEQRAFGADEVRAIEARAFTLGVLAHMQAVADVEATKHKYVLPGAPGTGWTSGADVDAFVAWFNSATLKTYKSGYNHGARSFTKTSLALLDLKGCRMAADLLRTALPAWVLA